MPRQGIKTGRAVRAREQDFQPFGKRSSGRTVSVSCQETAKKEKKKRCEEFLKKGFQACAHRFSCLRPLHAVGTG